MYIHAGPDDAKILELVRCEHSTGTVTRAGPLTVTQVRDSGAALGRSQPYHNRGTGH